MLFTDINRTSGTRNLADELPEFRTNPVFKASGSSKFSSGMTLRISIEDKNTTMELDPASTRLLIGRRDSLSNHTPDIDMEDHEGYRLGVSRKHAQFLLDEANEELSLQDIGSANGTFLNGVRLPAHRPHKVQDGDEVRLGNLTLRVYFI
jgi:predicted component of type VI protein secretion system